MENALHRDAHIKNLVNCAFSIFIALGLFTLEICHLSLKHSLLFNMFNSFNVNIERFVTIHRTDILQKNIS